MAHLRKQSKRGDTMPSIRAAGIGAAPDDEVKNIFTPDLDPKNANRPATPEHVRKYRASFQKAPGRRFINTGMLDSDLPPEHTRYGVRSAIGESAAAAMGQNVGSEMDQFLQSQKESIYRSNQREPLGRTYQRPGHELPEETNDEKFRFGIQSDSSESAKTIIYAPHLRKDNDIDTQWLSVGPQAKGNNDGDQFNNDRDVCHQHTRNYDWKEIDPSNHRFGKPLIKSNQYGVTDALNHNVHQTVVGSKRVDQINRARADPLGRTRNFRDFLLDLPEDYTFGSKSTRDEWGAKKCIRGDYTPDAQQPDDDLGKITMRRTVKIRLKDEPQADRSRRFGLPSMRSDILAPKFRSVADPNNYGDESDAMGLLYPSKYAFDGVDINDFTQERSKDQIRRIFKAIQCEFTDEQFEQMCNETINTFNKLSVDNFRTILNQRDERLASRVPVKYTQSQGGGKFQRPTLV